MMRRKVALAMAMALAATSVNTSGITALAGEDLVLETSVVQQTDPAAEEELVISPVLENDETSPMEDVLAADPDLLLGETSAEVETTPTLVSDGAIAVDATNFPDAKFLAYVKENIDANGDNELSQEEIDNVEEIDVDERNIADLTGIGNFKSLYSLSCDNNQLTKLDLSGNVALEVVSCVNNELVHLDVSNSEHLWLLACSNNQLKTLDVTQNKELDTLYCGGNELTSLDVSENVCLADISCEENHLTALDLSKNESLVEWWIGLQTRSVPVQSTADGWVLDMAKVVGAGNFSNVRLLDWEMDEAGRITFPEGELPEVFTYYYTCAEDVEMHVVLTLETNGDTDQEQTEEETEEPTETESDDWGEETEEPTETESDTEEEEPSPEGEGVTLDATNFPDANFLAYVKDSINEDGDEALSQEEIESVDELYISELEIANLTGIGIFVNLRDLDCSGNQLEELDLRQNTKLEYVNCSSNKLERLDVSGNEILYSLECQDNQLKTLDVTHNKDLSELYCGGNHLTTLDVSKNDAEIYLESGTQTRSVSVQSTGDGWILDMTEVVGAENLSRVSLSDWEMDGDGVITFPEAELPATITYDYRCTEDDEMTVNLTLVTNGDPEEEESEEETEEPTESESEPEEEESEEETESPTESESDTEEQESEEETPSPEGEDVALTPDNFPDEKFRGCISEFDLDKDGALSQSEIGEVDGLFLQEDDIKDLTGIEVFWNLQYLDCQDNYLTSLDVSKNTALESLNCGNNQLRILDLSHNQKLTSLYCEYNQLQALDVSKNTALMHLDCSGNRLAMLDVSKNTELTSLSCGYQTREIDLEETPTGWQFDMKKLVGEKNLDKVEISDEINEMDADGVIRYSKNGIPDGISYKYACTENETMYVSLVLSKEIATLTPDNFPDENFRTYLSRFDENGDKKLSAVEVGDLDRIFVYDSNITDLTGIEFFGNLTFLDCSYNQLTSLDVSKNEKLQSLDCSENQLTALDVSKNEKLQSLDCYNNQLTVLNVGKNDKIQRLECSNNKLTVLDVSKNPQLKELDCSYNQLTSLGVTQNEKLENLDCADNQLTSLDVTKNEKLVELSCGWNQLTMLDVAKNAELTHLWCSENQLVTLDVTKNAELTVLACSSNQLVILDVSQNAKLEYLSCEFQERTILLQETASGWVLDMAQIVGRDNLPKLIFPEPVNMDANGIIVFPTIDDVPWCIEYAYPCMKEINMSVYLYWEAGLEQEDPEYPDDTDDPLTPQPNPSPQQPDPTPQQPNPSPQQPDPTPQQPQPTPQPSQPAHTEHTYGSYVTTRAATAVQEGLQERKCVICGASDSRTIDRLPAKMKLTATSIKLKVGQSTNKIKVSGLAYGDSVESWKSSNVKVVIVNQSGKIVAKRKTGKATITVTLKSGLKKKIQVTVQKKDVACTSVKIAKKSVTLKKGKSYSIKPTIQPVTCVQKAKYKSSNTAVASVSSSGKVKAKKKGSATITVTVGKKKVKCKIKVK